MMYLESVSCPDELFQHILERSEVLVRPIDAVVFSSV